ncbi:MAG: virulence factor Mce family protein [Marmoricola sp.]|nr:virulence factor Mce family protein [Marmoricola sp.]
MRRLVTSLVGVLVTAVLVSGCQFDGAYDLPLPGNKVSGDDGYIVTADFADALNVVPRTAVMVDDVVVGQVTEVRRSGWHARVKFLVRKDIKLPENVQVDVRQTSLLGEKYIALVQPEKGTASNERLSAGDFIPLSRTGRNPEVEEVLGALSMVLSGGGIGQLKTISVELNKMLNGRQDQARHLLGNLDRLVAGLNDQRSDIIAAMDSINRLSSTLVNEKQTIGDAIDAMGPALKVLNNQHSGLMKMLRQLDALGEVGTRVLNASTDNIVVSLRHLQPTLTQLADAGDALPKGLSLIASFPFPKEAGNIAKGDYANALFHIDFDLNKILKSPGDALPDPINLCVGALPSQIGTLCKGLDDATKALVCQLNPKLAEALCTGASGGAGLPKNPPIPSLTGAGSNSSGGSGLGGLGGLLGGGG